MVYTTTEAILEAAKANNVRIVAAEDVGTNGPWDEDLTGDILLVVGAERDGVSPEVLAAADAVVKLPMDGFVPSYNLQVAVSVLAVEALRQRQSLEAELKQGWAPAGMGFFATNVQTLSMGGVVQERPGTDGLPRGVMSLACLIGMSMPQLLVMDWAVNADGSFTPAYLMFSFVGYMVLSIVVVFWNCAIIANANIRLTGGDPKFADGVNAALKRLPIIIVWGIIAGTVGLLLKFLEGVARSSDHPAAAAASHRDSHHRRAGLVGDDLLHDPAPDFRKQKHR